MTVFHEISPETIDRYEELKAQRKRLKQRKLFFSYEYIFLSFFFCYFKIKT